MGAPDPATAARLAKKLEPVYPSQSDPLNRELCIVLVYLKSPSGRCQDDGLVARP